MAPSDNELSDDELCVLNNLMYNNGIYERALNRSETDKAPILQDIVEELPYDKGLESALITKDEWDMLVKKVNSDPKLANLKVYDVDSNTSQGSRNVCFMDDDGNPIVVMKGTGHDDDTGESEWPDNCSGLSRSDTEQQLESKAYIEYIHARTGKLITATGHSKGGNEVMYCTITTDCVKRCVAFDGQGVSSETMARYADQIKEKRGLIKNYHTEGDFVNCLLNPLAGEEIYIQASRLGSNYAKNHSPIALLDDTMKLGPRGKQTAGSREINRFTLWLDKHALPEDKWKMASALGGLTGSLLGSHDNPAKAIEEAYRSDPEGFMLVLAYLLEYPRCDDMLLAVLSEAFATPLTSLTGSEMDALVNGVSDTSLRALLMKLISGKAFLAYEGTSLLTATLMSLRRRIRNGGRGGSAPSALTSSLVHDFSEAKLEELIGIIKQIESEPWYDVTRWDVWYRGERFLGRLNIDNYKQDITTYYRKTLDACDISEQEIRRRFGKAKEMDGTYARQVATISENVGAAQASLDDFTYGV